MDRENANANDENGDPFIWDGVMGIEKMSSLSLFPTMDGVARGRGEWNTYAFDGHKVSVL